MAGSAEDKRKQALSTPRGWTYDASRKALYRDINLKGFFEVLA